MSTLTVYSDAGDPGSTTCDGVIRYLSSATWAEARDAASGNDISATATSAILVQSTWGGVYYVGRGFFLFDASALTAAANISSAVISFAASAAGVTNADTTAAHIVSCTPASNTTLELADYSQIGATSFASMNLSSWVDTDGTYNDFTLDANGIANISKTGISKFATRNSRDLNDSAATGINALQCYYADQTGTTKDPKLVITYSSTAIKTFNGIAIASVKTINGVAIASVKTINGVA